MFEHRLVQLILICIYFCLLFTFMLKLSEIKCIMNVNFKKKSLILTHTKR